jgi:hypothetical protein
MRKLLGVVALLTIGAADAPSGKQFNLVCTGTHKHFAIGGELADTSEAWSETYRIDLGSLRYCEGNCSAVRPIKEVQPTEIILRFEEEETPTSKSREMLKLDRLKSSVGAEHYFGDPRSDYIRDDFYDGACERKPFSGFPKFDTKF